MRSFQELTNLHEIERFIDQNELSFIYISKPNCSVCHSLLPQVRRLLKNYPSIRLGNVNADTVKEVAGKWNIFTVPVLLLFLNGKEILREARIVHLDLLDQKLNKIYKNVVEP